MDEKQLQVMANELAKILKTPDNPSHIFPLSGQTKGTAQLCCKSAKNLESLAE